MDNDTQQSLEQLQELEQKIQSFSIQRQSFEARLAEIENVLSELSRSRDGIYKVIGQIMFPAQKSTLEKELQEKKKLFSLRISSIEKQELPLLKQMEDLKLKITSKLKNLKS